MVVVYTCLSLLQIVESKNKCQDICVKNLTFVYLQKNSFNYENS